MICLFTVQSTTSTHSIAEHIQKTRHRWGFEAIYSVLVHKLYATVHKVGIKLLIWWLLILSAWCSIFDGILIKNYHAHLYLISSWSILWLHLLQANSCVADNSHESSATILLSQVKCLVYYYINWPTAMLSLLWVNLTHWCDIGRVYIRNL